MNLAEFASAAIEYSASKGRKGAIWHSNYHIWVILKSTVNGRSYYEAYLWDEHKHPRAVLTLSDIRIEDLRKKIDYWVDSQKPSSSSVRIALISIRGERVLESDGDDLRDAIQSFVSRVWEEGWNADQRVLDLYGDWGIYQFEGDNLIFKGTLRSLIK
jgi:hypothetical protein